MTRCVLYSRVSTNRQEVENQLIQLREFSLKNGYQIVREYTDHESGAKSDREQFRLLFKDAYQRNFDIVIFWSLDRFSREGARQTINYLAELESYAVGFISFTEPYLNSEFKNKEIDKSKEATSMKQSLHIFCVDTDRDGRNIQMGNFYMQILPTHFYHPPDTGGQFEQFLCKNLSFFLPIIYHNNQRRYLPC